jgi:hypothetical protein
MSADRRDKPTTLAEIEQALKHRLKDRVFWLVAGMGLYLGLMLSLLATRFPEQVKTFDLLARIVVVVEATLVLLAIFLAWQTAARWVNGPTAMHSRLSLGLSGLVVIPVVVLCILMTLLYFQQYADLAEQSIHVPVTLLQRVVLLTLVVVTQYNVLLALLLQLRLPAWTAIPAVLSLHLWISHSVSRLSHSNPSWHKLNDIFYWNQLWHHLPEFPNLATDRAIHNIGQPTLAIAITLLLVMAVLTSALWLPAAAKLDRRETAQ